MEQSMTGNMLIQPRWEPAVNESLEVGQTSAWLRIVLGNEIVTWNDDVWSNRVNEEVRLSMYPLALWFATSWWRLRWEPLPAGRTPTRSWRMAHELGAAGHGYLWPRMLFASDGENVNIWAVQSPPETKAAIRYLKSAYSALSGMTFERVIDEFINEVVTQLKGTKVGRTTLNDLWEEVVQERRDKSLAEQRRLEAILGFDPDECSEALIGQFENLIPKAGHSSVTEIASICAVPDPGSAIQKIVALANSGGLEGKISLSIPAGYKPDDSTLDWQRGRDLARKIRHANGLNGEGLSDGDLADLVGVSSTQFDGIESKSRYPLGIAVREKSSEKLKFHIRKRYRTGRRFEMARFICDFLTADQSDSWLPVTDAKTARQRMQRAFAAEFLCPINALKDFLGDDFSTDAVDDAAKHFGVAQVAIQTQLVNNKLLPQYVLDEYNRPFDFPYVTSSQASADFDIE